MANDADNRQQTFELKNGETFERKGGYASPRVPRSQMRPPPASASQQYEKSPKGDSSNSS